MDTFALLFLILFVAVTSVVIKYSIKRYNYSKILPGPRLRFFNFLGNVTSVSFRSQSRNGFSLNCSLLQLVRAYCALFGSHGLICGWIGFVPMVFLVKAKAVEDAISGTRNMEKALFYKLLHPWLGTGLLTSYGRKWKSRRKLLTHSFHFDILKDFLPIFNEQSQLLVKLWQKETDTDFTDIVLPIQLCTLDIIAETTLGVKIRAQGNCKSEYVKAISRVTGAFIERIPKMWYWPDFLYGLTKSGKIYFKDIELLHNFTRSVIRERKSKIMSENAETSKPKRKALLDSLLEHHIHTKTLTEEDIREEVDTFVFEGHDTTAVGICWALYLIGLNKDVQEKVHEELDRIFGNDFERHVTTEDLKDMEYLERVVKETQRLYPPIPFVGRLLDKDSIICGYKLPEGSMAGIMIYHLHRDPDVFPNPEKFDPDRFLPQNSLHRHPYAYVPFSAGPRNCIGQRFAVLEEKVVISNILRNFVIVSLDERDKLPPVPEITLRSPLPIRVRIRPRVLK